MSYSTTIETEKSVTKLLYACADGDLVTVQRLAAQGFDINGADYDSRTALHLAAAEGHEEVVRYLVHLGAAVTAADRFGHTAIDESRRHGSDDVTAFLTSALEASSDTSSHIPLDGEPPMMAYLSLDTTCSGSVTFQHLIDALTESGINLDEPRIAAVVRARVLLRDAKKELTLERFTELCTACPLLLSVVRGELVVPDFQVFSDELVEVEQQSPTTNPIDLIYNCDL